MADPHYAASLSRLLPRTLQARLSMLVMAMLLAGFWIFGLAVNQLQERRQQELLAAQQFSAVGYVAEDIESKIRLRLDGLAMIADRFPLDDLASPERARAYLVDRRAIYNLFDGGLIVVKPDASGALADYPPVAGRLTNRYDIAPFKDVIATGKSAVGPPRMAHALGRPVVVFAAPIRGADGRLAAVLAGVTGINSSNFLDLVAKPRPGTRGDYLVAAPAHGLFVTGTDPAFTLKPLPTAGTNALLDRYVAGFEGSGIGSGADGFEELSSSRRIPSTDWLVIARLPTSEAFSPIRENRKLIIGAAALLSALVALITLAILHRALRPLANAAAEMQAMTRGEAPLHPLPLPGECEVGILVDSFNELQARVARNETELRLAGTTYRGIFDAVGEALFVFDANGTILDVNQGAVTMYGRPRAALIGNGAKPLAAPGRNDRKALQAAVRAAMAGKPQQFEFWGRSADGADILNDVRLYPSDYFGRRAVVAVARDITARRRQEEAAQQAEQRFSIVFRTSPIPITIARAADGGFVEVNAAFLQLFARKRADTVGKTSVEIGYWPSIEARQVWLDALQREGALHNHEVVLCPASGDCLTVLMSSAFIDFAGEPCIVNFIHDITQEKQAKEGLRLMANIFTHSHDGMLIVDADATIIDVNPAFTAHTGYARDEAIGRNPRFLQSGRHDAEFFYAMWKSLLQIGMWQGEIWNRKKNGELMAEMLTISAVPSGRAGEHKYVGIFTDITRLKETQAELEQMAHYDALTHLPNRALLRDRLNQAVAHARRRKYLLGVCFIDLDDFKPINDTHGHKAGDHLLVEVAKRLQAAVRGEDTVARLGGDEFVVLLTDIRDLMELESALQRLVDTVTRPCLWAEQVLQVSASIGVTVYPHDGADPETLLRHADLSMYAAKQAGRNRYCFFDPGQDKLVRQQFEQQQRLRLALERDELVLHYQPKVHMRSGQVVGVEALIRWNHPEDGLKAPDQFLPFAEESDLIVDIGVWTLRTALRQIRAWRQEGLQLPVAVNIAARHLKRPDFVAQVAALLAEYPDLPANSLELEVVETSALEDMDKARLAIEGCAQLGVSCALDDFGTGYSSLVYLRSLPVKCLKIDGSFISNMGGDPHDLAIVEGVVGMGTAFGRTVIAECVETAEQGVLLLQLGCEIAQGYGIARPMPGAAVVPWVNGYQPFAAWQSDESSHWRREDFSLLAAEVDHRYWVERVLGAIKGAKCGSLPPLGDRDCRFGRWYHGEGRERYGHVHGFVALDALHAAIHATANEALQLAAAGANAEALRMAGVLEASRDAMVLALRELRHSVVAIRRAGT